MSADDRLEIMEMVARYAYAWDEKNAHAYAACFTDDAEFEVYTRGPRGARLPPGGPRRHRALGRGHAQRGA